MRLLALALSFAATTATADPDRVSVLLGSKHFGSDDFEEVNPGVFLTWEGRTNLTVGAYRNSYGDGSVAATAALPFARWTNGEAQVFGGLAYYSNAEEVMRYHIGDFVPLVGVQARQGNFFGQLIPMDGESVDALATFGLTFELN